MVFQQFNLFPHLTVMQNLTLAPMWVTGMPKAEAEERAMTQLKRVRIAEQAQKFPLQLSGGQQQRVAIARALSMTISISGVSLAAAPVQRALTSSGTAVNRSATRP